MSIVREFIKTIAEQLVPGLIDSINSFAEFLFQNVNTTFSAYKSQAPPDPGWGSLAGLLGLFLGLTFLVIGVFAFRTIIRRSLRVLNQEDALPTSYQWGLGALLYLVFQFAFATNLNPISIAKRTKIDIAVIGSILNNQLPGYSVEMQGFTLGILQNTLLEFVLQVGLLTFALSLVAWWYTDFVSWPESVEFVIDFSPMIAPVILWIYVSVNGIQVFPVGGRTAFLIQSLSLVGLMILIAAGLVWLGYLVWIWPSVGLDADRPQWKWITFDGTMLAIIVAIAGSGFVGLLLWVFAKIATLHYRSDNDDPGKQPMAEGIPGGD